MVIAPLPASSFEWMQGTGCGLLWYGGAADEVYVEMKKKAKDAILALVEKERDGEQIDRTLLKNVLVRRPLPPALALGTCAECWLLPVLSHMRAGASVCFR